jgi:hypothetical protein
MEQSDTFLYGITTADGKVCREFVLAERTFRHSLEVVNDPSIAKHRLSDPTFYDAAILTKRLRVDGVEKLTPEQILDLDGEDGDILAQAMVGLDERRSEFRRAQQTAADAADSAVKDGDPLE